MASPVLPVKDVSGEVEQEQKDGSLGECERRECSRGETHHSWEAAPGRRWLRR